MTKKIFFLFMTVLIAASVAGCKNKAKQIADAAFKKVKDQNYAGAIADYDEAIKLAPNNAEFYVKRGFVKKFGLKQDEEGCKDMLKGVALGYNKLVKEHVEKACKK